MASLSSMPFVSLAKYDGSLVLSGDKAARPLVAGQTIVAHGLFDDGTETGPAVFVVLRLSGKHHTYDFAPLGCTDRYWSKHLGDSPSISAKLLSRHDEKVSKDVDQITRWQVLAEPGEQPLTSALTLLGKAGAEKALKKWAFLADYVRSDKQAGNDPPFHGNFL